jgi:RimJ/RimL family protein N-acetyltransferase
VALTGEKVRLRELTDDDLPLLVRLRNDLGTQAWSRTLPPDYTLDMIRQRYAGQTFQYKRDSAMFIIELLETDEAIGVANYAELVDRFEAMIGIMVDRPWWGSGVAYEANELLLKFLFEELGLRVVRLWTQSENERAIGSAQKLGFTVSVRVPGTIFKAGAHHDNVMMDLLREEWYALHSELTDRLVDPFR